MTGYQYLVVICETDINDLGLEKLCLMPYANNKGAIRLRRLISAFVVRCQDRIIPLVYVSEISRFELVFVAEQVSLCLAWSETPEDTFSHGVAQIHRQIHSLYIY